VSRDLDKIVRADDPMRVMGKDDFASMSLGEMMCWFLHYRLNDGGQDYPQSPLELKKMYDEGMRLVANHQMVETLVEIGFRVPKE